MPTHRNEHDMPGASPGQRLLILPCKKSAASSEKRQASLFASHTDWSSKKTKERTSMLSLFASDSALGSVKAE